MDRTLAWVLDLPQLDSVEYSNRKRRRYNHLASPPTSAGADEDEMSSTPKKRRLDSRDILFDPDATPRAGPSSIATSSPSASETSSVSGASSPKKQLMSLRINNSGIDHQSLNDRTVPECAKTLFMTMFRIGRSIRILPDTLRTTIRERIAERQMDFDQWESCFRSPLDVDELPGRIPSFEEIERVFVEAEECENFRHEENAWNSQVYLRLLEGIFKTPQGKRCDAFGSMSCTTARLHRDFRPVSSTAKMIDICVFTSSEQDTNLRKSVIDFCQLTPTLCVNHTDFEPIQLRPLILSIETKKPGVDGDKAKLQMGVWHAAQWNFLSWAVGQKLSRQWQTKRPGEQMPDDEIRAARSALLAKLGFIPGVIIQGHEWRLVLSTYNDDGRTTLWAQRLFGSTTSLVDTYSIISGIRELAAWGRDFYLPWFKQAILD